MNGFEVYQTYIALKSHFNSKSYDYTRYQGKTNVSINSWNQRNEQYEFNKVAKRHGNQSFKYLLANFCRDANFWIGDDQAEHVYRKWIARIEGLSFTFRQDLAIIAQHLESEQISFKEFYSFRDDQFPGLFSFHLSSKIVLETSMILIMGLGLFEAWERSNHPLTQLSIYKEERLRITKYARFFDIPHFTKKFREDILVMFRYESTHGDNAILGNKQLCQSSKV